MLCVCFWSVFLVCLYIFDLGIILVHSFPARSRLSSLSMAFKYNPVSSEKSK